MPTDIYFTGENMRVKVDEEPGQVAEAFTSANGLPFRLTVHGEGADVYVNPATVAFWLVSEAPQELDEPQEPAAGRQVVTDIWGQPLRRKPRR